MARRPAKPRWGYTRRLPCLLDDRYRPTNIACVTTGLNPAIKQTQMHIDTLEVLI
jgi:hypothetical protein